MTLNELIYPNDFNQSKQADQEIYKIEIQKYYNSARIYSKNHNILWIFDIFAK